jgi:DNA polymerase III epsilon subunit family exonuclease
VRLLALDFETTGLDSVLGRVVEVGAVRFSLIPGGYIEEASLACLVDPGMTIPRRASDIHGISDADVAGAPSFGEVVRSLLALAEGATIVAHNVRFDLSFLDAELARLGLSRGPAETADTVKLSRRAFPGRASYRLGAIAAALGIDAGAAHRALDDARTCMRLYSACMERLGGEGHLRSRGGPC